MLQIIFVFMIIKKFHFYKWQKDRILHSIVIVNIIKLYNLDTLSVNKNRYIVGELQEFFLQTMMSARQ